MSSAARPLPPHGYPSRLAENRRDIETILPFSYLNCGKNMAQYVFRLIG